MQSNRPQTAAEFYDVHSYRPPHLSHSDLSEFDDILADVLANLCPEPQFTSSLTGLLAKITTKKADTIPSSVRLQRDGDCDVRKCRPGSKAKRWEDVAMQQEIREWAMNNGKDPTNSGVFKPDVSEKLVVRLPGVTKTVFGLVGERKVILVEDVTRQPVSGEVASSNDRMRAPSPGVTAKWRAGLSKAILYLITAHQVCGTDMGIVHIGSRFSRLHLTLENTRSRRKIVIKVEVSSSSSPQPAPMKASQFLADERHYHLLAHDLVQVTGTHQPPLVVHNPHALTTLWNTHEAVRRRLLKVQVESDPLVLPPRPATHVETWASVHCAVASKKERFDITLHCRPDSRFAGPETSYRGRNPSSKRGSSTSTSDPSAGARKSPRLAALGQGLGPIPAGRQGGSPHSAPPGSATRGGEGGEADQGPVDLSGRPDLCNTETAMSESEPVEQSADVEHASHHFPVGSDRTKFEEIQLWQRSVEVPTVVADTESSSSLVESPTTIHVPVRSRVTSHPIAKRLVPTGRQRASDPPFNPANFPPPQRLTANSLLSLDRNVQGLNSTGGSSIHSTGSDLLVEFVDGADVWVELVTSEFIDRVLGIVQT